ncbi:MAG TPA: SufE family protein [Puia sp.]|nr:SufE family protein [Puia sp.]
MTINEQQDEYIADFEFLENWEQRYEYIIDIGKKLAPMDEKYKTEENIIKGCQSTVWLHGDLRNGRVFFAADSNTQIIKGVVAMFVGVFSGHTPAEILDADVYFVEKTGLQSFLTSNRSNGLVAMLKQIKLYAVAFQAKSLQQ